MSIGALPRLLLGGLILAALAIGEAATASDDPLSGPSGLWTGSARHNGQECRIGLRLEPAKGDTLDASLSIPILDVWDVAVGPATLDTDTLRVSSWKLIFDGGEGIVRGVLPPSLVPKYEIPFTLRRAEALDRAPRSADSPPLAQPTWTRSLSAPVWAGIAFDDGSIFVGGDDGAVHALRAEDGSARWSFSTGGPIRARPTPTATMVFVHSDDGHLYALDREGGREQWRARLQTEPHERIPPGAPESRYDCYASSATVSGERIYVGDDAGGLHALDRSTGRELWAFRAEDSVASTPAVDGERVYFGSFDGRVYALDVADGEVVWVHETGGGVTSSPLLLEDQLLVGNRNYDFLSLDSRSGHPRWKHYVWFSWIESSASAYGSTVYVGSSDAQRLFALDAGDGRSVWTVETGGWTWPQPAVTEEAVYQGVIGVEGYFVEHQARFLAADRASGEVLWHFPREQRPDEKLWGFASSPAVGAGLVFVGELDGQIYAFSQDVPH